ncbi:peptidoglycan glycosyltransferase [Ancylomarina euxinus]|uniref:Peptidoglycan glycosyltransferase n=1 Tax=Ancylomarina euxinus TaxID=2283627 RepID=A0A425XYJ7_9BACT|nr:transglycosylase domain-containing protein [Ancylomarina euxinus]MCZ4695728.1 transglycosylase domain-containing protein [Ancylomarina euxinus]MUP16181.1 peptidoglycan glycosyltransferase [Ancylomarina euxinus]RRG20042.1 peptidoglycan glycosyltransferase [Ancylomarina euxinus]
MTKGKNTTIKPIRKNTPKRNSALAKKGKTKKTFKNRIFRFLFFSLLIAGSLFGLFLVSVYYGAWGKLPDYHTLKNIQNADASEVYSEDGKILGRIYAENRTNIDFSAIPINVINALVATEDSRFYSHEGIDEISLVRVLVKTLILGNKNSGGGSTLSQQLAKNLYPRRDFGKFSMPVNKIKEAITASRLEKIYSKKKILQLYLNTVPFGEQVFGIESASRQYFSKPAHQLKLDESAVLIGMLKAPSYYNPRRFPERSKQRRNVVLGQMTKNNFISENKAEQLKQQPLKINYQKQSTHSGLAPYLRERIRVEADNILKKYTKADGSYYDIYRDGLRILSTVDYSMQTYAEDAVKSHMNNLQGLFYKHWGNQNPWDNNKAILTSAIERSPYYKKLKDEGKNKQEIDKLFKTKRESKIFTWNGEKDVKMSPLDSIKHYIKLLNTGFVAMESNTGKIKAWVGGIDFKHFQYDHVTGRRQVGSIFKPIVYAAALEANMSPFDYYPNERKVYAEYQDWSPRNADNNYEGSYSMEGALAESVNTIAVDLIMETGIESTIELAEEMGVSSPLPNVPSLALGTANISLLEMIQVYANLANRGKRVDPYYISRIETNKGEVIVDLNPLGAEFETSLSPENADIINHMLTAVVDSGTAKSLRTVYGLKGEFAGKTGTTQSQADGWYIGYNQNLVAGAWVGAADMRVHFRSLALGQGATMALPIYGKFMHQLNNNSKYDNYCSAPFFKPDNTSLAKLDMPHYMPPRANFFERLLGLDNKKDDKIKLEERRAKRKKNKKSIYDKIKSIFGGKNKD